MNIIIDTNIFIAALIKDGRTRELITRTKATLLFPEFEWNEIKNNEEEIIKKSKLSEQEFKVLVNKLSSYVKIIKIKEIENYLNEAKEIIGQIDEDDVIFIATALAFNNCPIWSDDKHFLQQNKIKIITTKEMLCYFEKAKGITKTL